MDEKTLISLLEGAERVYIDLGGPFTGAYVHKDQDGCVVGVWDGQRYLEAEARDFRDALEIGLAEDLDTIREIRRAA